MPDETVELDEFMADLGRMSELEKTAASLSKADSLYGSLAALNANGLSLRDTFAVHALVLSNRILRSPAVEYDNAGQHFADLIRPKV